MNNDYCDTRTTFGQTIERDTRVKVIIRTSGATLAEGVTSHLIAPSGEWASVRLDGLNKANRFHAADVTIEVIEPPIEPGFYMNTAGVVFKITGERDKRPSLYHLRHIGTEDVSYKAPCREHEYYSSIRQGTTVRIADIKGYPVSA